MGRKKVEQEVKQVAKKTDLGKDKTDTKKRQVLQCLEKALGVVTTACKKANIHRSQFYQWIHDDHEFAANVRDIEDIVLDFAESQLYQQVSGGNTAAILFLLKTKGKKRGYIERTEISGTDGEKIDFTIQVVQGDKILPFKPE